MNTPLDQDKTWTTRDGRTLALEDMEPSHRRNLQWFLRARATTLWSRYNWNTALSMSLHYGDGDHHEMPDGVYASFSQIEHQALEPDPKLAKEWLESTPFMKRLSALVADDLAKAARTHSS